MTAEQLQDAGIAARRLLEWAWAADPRDSAMVTHGIEVVARSYGSDPAASGALLRRAIAPEHLARFGFEEGFSLAEALEHILPHDPEFVRDVYGAMFGFVEQSDEATPMGGSRILSMSSTRRQDYGMAQYSLGEVFKRFVELAPEQATEAAIKVAEGYVGKEHYKSEQRTVVVEKFTFLGLEASLEHDMSFIWDAGSVHEKDAGLDILSTLGSQLASLAGTAPDTAQRCLALIAHGARHAIVWRRLLRAGTGAPNTLGMMIRELVASRPILTSLETCTQAGTLLTAIFPALVDTERRRIEQVILGIPEGQPENTLKSAERRRDTLLGCLPRESVITDEARARLAELDAAGDVPPNTPAFHIETHYGGSVTTDELLEQQGVDVGAPAHRALLDLGEELKRLPLVQTDIDGDTVPVADLTERMRSLLDALHAGERDGVDPEVLKTCWEDLAETALRVAQLNATCAKPIAALARTVLLESANQSARSLEPDLDARFDAVPSWSSPAPRVTGALGQALLARHPDCVDADLLESIDRLSRDSDPAVRLQIASHLWRMHESAPDRLWAIVEQMSANETSTAVLRGLIGHSLPHLESLDPSRAVRIAADVLARFRKGPGSSGLRETCLRTIAALHVWLDVAEATQVLAGLLKVDSIDLEDAAHMITELRRALFAERGPSENDLNGSRVRERAIDLVHRLLEPTLQEISRMRGSSRSANEWPTEETERFRSLLKFADLVGRELYFATGILEERREGNEAKVPTEAQRERFFVEARVLLEIVADVGLASSTHHLLEMLEHFIDHDPREAFLLIVRALRAGEWGGYQYESLGQSLFVRLVERYLAEHRRLFQEDQDCKSGMLAVLDIFVRAGWPSAQRLSYRLDEIFR